MKVFCNKHQQFYLDSDGCNYCTPETNLTTLNIINYKSFHEKPPAAFTGIGIYPDGSKEHLTNGRLHNLEGPAYEGASGEIHYWVDHELHRLDGPAVILPDGTQEYWVGGLEHDKDYYPEAVKTYKAKNP